MNNIYTYLICTILFPFSKSICQSPITIAESTFKISGIGKEVFRFGLCQGDKLIFDFEEVNGKDLKEIEILEYPNASKFMDYKTSGIYNKTIDITTSGIYEFRFTNAAIGKRICKYKIQRIPGTEETVNFNTSVYNKTILDTTYTIVKERYLVKEEYNTKTISPLSKYYINGGLNATFQGGTSRVTIPVTLPPNTVEWYYSFSSFRDEQAINSAMGIMNLASKLAPIADQSGALSITIDMLNQPPGGDICDLYLLDYTNSQLFKEKSAFRHFGDGSRQNLKSAIVKLNQFAGRNLYLGIKNPSSRFGIHVALEVVAITFDQQWGIRDVKKPRVTKRKELYLNN